MALTSRRRKLTRSSRSWRASARRINPPRARRSPRARRRASLHNSMAHGAEVGGHVAPVLGAVLGAGVIYVAGWRAMSRRTPPRFGPRRLAAFLGGLGAIVLAVGSPLDALAGRLLQAHMTQHMLLMMVAPPLLWLGAPVAPMLLGVPRQIRRAVAAGLAAPSLRRI